MITNSDLQEAEQATAALQETGRLQENGLVGTRRMPVARKDNDFVGGIVIRGITQVTFNSQPVVIEALLGLPLNAGSPEVEELAALVRQLNVNACTAQKLGLRESVPVFMAHGKSDHFKNAVARLVSLSSWQLKFMPSRINPGRGYDISVIVP